MEPIELEYTGEAYKRRGLFDHYSSLHVDKPTNMCEYVNVDFDLNPLSPGQLSTLRCERLRVSVLIEGMDELEGASDGEVPEKAGGGRGVDDREPGAGARLAQQSF